MTPEEVRALILSFPEVEDSTSYGYPSYKVAGKFLTRLRSEDQSLVLGEVGFDEREMLMAAEPQVFHLTPHYEGYPCVLARIETIDPGTLKAMLTRIWRKKAPRKLVKAWDAQNRAT